MLHKAGVSAFDDLERALGPMIRNLGGEPDGAYSSDPRWPSVVARES